MQEDKLCLWQTESNTIQNSQPDSCLGCSYGGRLIHPPDNGHLDTARKQQWHTHRWNHNQVLRRQSKTRVSLRPACVTICSAYVALRPSWVTIRPACVTIRSAWVTLRPALVTICSAYVTLRPSWVTLRSACITLHSNWVTLRPACITLRSALVTICSVYFHW